MRESQVPQNEIDILLGLADKCNARYALEVGTWCGNTAIPLAQKVKENNGKLICVDHFKGNVGTDLIESAAACDVYGMFKGSVASQGLEDTIITIIGDSKHLRFIKPYCFDFVFIDGDHRYSGVSKDIDNLWLSVRPGGILCGHDYNSREFDERYIEVDFVEGVHHGVTKAVNEAFEKVNVESTIWWVQK
jgi:predicted O-methyltransferase YrrM